MPLDDREKRMQLFAGFLQQLETARAGALEQVSEVDLADAHDLRATLTGLQTGNAIAASARGALAKPGADTNAPVLVHFGDSDFEAKYETLMEKMGQWQASAGKVESVDMRFNGEAVVKYGRAAVAQHGEAESGGQAFRRSLAKRKRT